MNVRRTLKLTSLLALVLVTALMAGASATAAPDSAVQGRYIVVFNDGVDVDAAVPDIAAAYGLNVTHVYRHALKGMAAHVPSGRLNGLQRDPRVNYVEADQEVHLFAQTVPTGIQRIFADDNENITIDGTDDYRIDVDAAVLDTGIDLDHPELNVVASTDCTNESGGPPWARTATCESGGDDGHGHGTHVSGTIGAIDNGAGVVGVAPGARLWAVKVLEDNGSGSNATVIAGIDYVTDNANDIEVANMSLGGGDSQAICDAISNSVGAGVTYAVAAGNDDADASNSSPANCTDVITVSALADFDGEPGGLITDTSPYCRDDQDDTLADFSNWGETIEITAPGVCILSTWNDGGYNTISGTSMASPHVAGAAALLAASGYNDPTTIRQTLIDEGNFNWTDDSGDDTQEPLLDVSNSEVFTPATVSGSSSPATDIAVTAVNAPASVVQGDVVSVDVTVENVGNQDVTSDINVTLTDDTDSVTIGTQTISGGLTAGASTTLTFSWDTTNASLGDHTLTASHDFTDDDASNDSLSTAVKVESAVTDIAITAVNAPSSVVQGDVVSVDVTVENMGNQDVTSDINVTLTDNTDSVTIGTQTISGGLTAGASTTLTFSWDTGSASLGDHTLTASHDFADDDSSNDSKSTTVSVNETSSDMHVGNLDGTSTNQGSTWTAIVTITIHDASHDPVADATVSGSWSGGASGTATCITGSDGTCQVSESGIHKRNGTVTFTVDDVTHDSLTYDSSANHDPDGDSDGTSITVAKP